MFKRITRIFFVACFFAVNALNLSAQEALPDTTDTGKDSIDAVLDSLSENVANNSDTAYQEDYDSEEGETLYFTGKEDSLSLYDSSVIEWRKIPDTTVLALQHNRDFWYANSDRSQQERDENDDENTNGFAILLASILGLQAIRQAIFIFILLLFALAVIWFLAKNQINLFGRRKGLITVDQTEGSQPDSMSPADLQLAVENAEKNEHYRLAIRLSYLLLLKRFSEEGWIKLTEDTTNMEYLSQLYTSPFYKEFFTVTRDYEYAWYGEMAINKPLYDRIQQDFAILYTKASLSN